MADTAQATEPDPYASVADLSGQGATAPAVDPYADVTADQGPTTTPQEAISTTAKAGASGFSKSAGMATGARLGFMATAAIPIPGARVVGTAVGAGLGFMAGSEASQQLDKAGLGVHDPAQLPPRLRPFGFGGEAFGGAGGFSGLALNLAKTGARMKSSFIGNYINRALDAIKRAPLTFLGVESSAAASSALGAGGAEHEAPGQTGVRITTEVGMGVLNPVNLAVNGSKVLFKGVSSLRRLAGSGYAENKAAEVLQDAVEAAGEDILALRQILDEVGIDDFLKAAGVKPITQTAAQRTGSDLLAVFEARLSTMNGAFSKEAKDLGDATLQNIEDTIKVLRGTGDPEALGKAAELQAQKYAILLQGRVAAAEREAAEAAAKITQDTPEAKEAISAAARKALDGALAESKAVETGLWDAVDKTIIANGNNTADTIALLKADMLPEEKLPKEIEGFLQRVLRNDKAEAVGKEIADKDIITTGQLILLRRRSLELARSAQAQGNFSDARIYGNVAETVLDDLDGLGDAAYDTARAFTRQRNDAFTRTFAGHAMAKGTKGDRVPPEIMMEKALATGGTKGAMQMRELEEATRFLDDIGGRAADGTNEFAPVMLDAQERMLRLAAANSIDLRTNEINPAKLVLFIRNNATLMKRFPEVKKDLTRALETKEGLEGVKRSVTHAEKRIEAEIGFAKIAKFENGLDAIRAAMNSPKPETGVNRLATLAMKSGGAAPEGFRSSMFDFAIQRASMNPEQGFSFPAFRRALFDEIRPGQSSIMDMMEGSGVISPEDVKQLTKLLDAADNVTKAGKASGRAAEDFPGGPAMIEDVVTRITGASLGTKVAKLFGANSIIAATTGSRFMTKIMNKIPSNKMVGVLIAATTDRKLMKMLLEKPKTETEAFELSRQFHSYLIQAGLTAVTDAEIPDLNLDIVE